MANLLLIDDDQSLTELLAVYFEELGYTVHIAHNGDEGLRAFFKLRPQLVILDVTMPERDGWQTLTNIRDLDDTPVIMLTARYEEANVLRGFALGADDYVSKPFSFAELAARARSVLGRAQSQAEKTEKTEKNEKDKIEEKDKIDKNEKNDKIATLPLLQYGDLVVDLATKRVWRHRELLHLTPTEFKLLVTLMQHVGQVLTPQDLVRSVWGEQYLDDVGYVRRYVWHLRKKIEPDPTKPSYIHNEHGFGYRFFPGSQSTDTPIVGE